MSDQPGLGSSIEKLPDRLTETDYQNLAYGYFALAQGDNRIESFPLQQAVAALSLFLATPLCWILIRPKLELGKWKQADRLVSIRVSNSDYFQALVELNSDRQSES